MRRLLIVLLVLVLAGGAGGLILYRPASAPAPSGRRSGADPIPVLVARAERHDVAIRLDGLGTVQASATVTLKPMVDGPLIAVLFKEGDDVRKGQVLARIDPRAYQATLDSAIAKKKQDEATLANDRLDMARYDKLVTNAYTSAQQAAAARAAVAEMEAQVQADQASIDSARTQLSYTTLASPIDGRIGFRQVDAGNIVHASDTTGLAVITTLKPILVQFTLPQQSLPQVAAAMAAGEAEVEALPQEAGAPTERTVLDRGTLSVLNNQVDSTTGTISLRASFPNEKLTLWPGAFVAVRLRVATLRNALTVPPVAVLRGPQGPYVYVIDADNLAHRRAVTPAHEDLTTAAIASGLTEGEQVVIDGASRLTDGAKVRLATLPDAT
jgi:multidrug efflux system membrane fusion protein